MKPLRKHLTREEVNDEEGDMEMAYSVAYQHTDGNRNYYGCYELHGINEKEPLVITTRGSLQCLKI